MSINNNIGVYIFELRNLYDELHNWEVGMVAYLDEQTYMAGLFYYLVWLPAW
jgi:hypothetical protein